MVQEITLNVHVVTVSLHATLGLEADFLDYFSKDVAASTAEYTNAHAVAHVTEGSSYATNNV